MSDRHTTPRAAWVAALAVPIAVTATGYAVLAWDRTTLLAMSAPWLLTWLAAAAAQSLAAALVLVGPWRGTVALTTRLRRLRWVLIAMAVPAAAYLLAMYGSDASHHALLFQTTWRGITIGMASVLPFAAVALWRVLAGEGPASGVTLLLRLRQIAGPMPSVALLAWGGILAATYVTVATDDLIRYWTVADALAVGARYPATVADPLLVGFYLIDLPLYPLLLWLGFTAAGHTLGTLYLPLLAAAALVPWLTYICLRQLGLAALPSYALAAALAFYPPFRIYLLGAAEPEPLFAALLLAAIGALLAAPRTNRWRWGVLGGALAAGAALTRPEGLPYTLPLLMGLLLRGPRRWWLAAAAAYGLPLGLFAAYLWQQFGIVWPTGWGRVASLEYVWPNLKLAWRDVVPPLAAMHRLPDSVLILLGAWCLGLFGLGCWRIVTQRRELLGLLLMPVVTLGVLLATPTQLSADLYGVYTLARHLGVPLPAVLLILALPLARFSPSSGAGRARQWAVAATAALPFAAALYFAGILATPQPTGSHGAIFGPDRVVLAQTLFSPPRPLPVYVEGEGRSPADISAAYHQFRDALYASLEPYDLRGRYDGTVWVVAAVVWLIVGAAGSLLTLYDPESGPSRSP